jgi:hypothetical protein
MSMKTSVVCTRSGVAAVAGARSNAHTSSTSRWAPSASKPEIVIAPEA